MTLGVRRLGPEGWHKPVGVIEIWGGPKMIDPETKMTLAVRRLGPEWCPKVTIPVPIHVKSDRSVSKNDAVEPHKNTNSPCDMIQNMKI